MRFRGALFAVIAVVVVLAGVVPAGAQDGGGGQPSVTTHVVESFDGTPILTHLFLPADASEDNPVPLVMRTHGWAGTGQTDISGTLAKLLDAGYAVVTWDQRGFGCSGGVVQVDKPQVEGKDASALISWAVDNAPIATEGGDPIVGFTGGSYAGGIQTATAGFDPRVDAIAPEITWQDLRYSLYENQVILFGWVEILYSAGVATASGQGLDPSCPTVQQHGPQTGGLAQEIHDGYAEGTATNQISQSVLDFFAASSLAAYGEQHPVDIPTLVMNGSVDTLFDATDGARIFHHVRGQGAPAKYIVFCGGHVSCPTSYEDADDRAHLDQAILDWFAKYLKGRDVDTGAPVEYRTNDGVWRTADDFTPPQASQLNGSVEGSLVSTPVPTAINPESLANQLRSSGGSVPATPVTAAQPSNPNSPQALAAEVVAAEGQPLEIVGIPTATVSVTGTGPAAHLFLKLVDREAGEVLNVQEAPLRVTDLSSEPQTFEVTMPGLAYTLPEGHHLDLQVGTTSAMHTTARTPAQVDVQVEVAVPVLNAAFPDGTSPAPPPRGSPAVGEPGGAPAAASAPAGTGADTGTAGDTRSASTLPATGGGGLAVALSVAALGSAVALWRRRDADG